MSALHRIATTPAQVKDFAAEVYHRAVQIHRDGKPVAFTVQEHEEDRTIQQNRYYFGVVLKEIAEQVNMGGTRYTAEAWHIHLKRTYLGYRVKKEQLPGRKRKSVIRELRSTKELSVRQFTKYLEQVQAYAITDLGVRFSAPDWREWRE